MPLGTLSVGHAEPREMRHRRWQPSRTRESQWPPAGCL